MKTLQKFSDEYLEHCKKMSPQQILEFLENFRILHYGTRKQKTRLISIKVLEPLLEAFRTKCEGHGVKYQTQIKALMEEWLKS